MECRARTANILDCTSNSGEKQTCRQLTGRLPVHQRCAFAGGEPGELNQRAHANGSTPLQSPNCVHYVSEPVGEHAKYLVYAAGRPIACLAWSSAPRHLGSRDRFIGWSAEARRRNIRFIAYNTRFLILPWVAVPHLASHILGRMAKVLPRDWEKMYGHPIYFLETFIDPQRFRGTSYLAANWIVMGRTTGRGKASNSHRPNRPIKEVLAYPLTKRFRQLMGGE